MIPKDRDPNRDWFLYDTDVEIGPIKESEVVIMIKSGFAFGDRVYGFCEGMTDWVSIDEIEVLF